MRGVLEVAGDWCNGKQSAFTVGRPGNIQDEQKVVNNANSDARMEVYAVGNVRKAIARAKWVGESLAKGTRSNA